MNSTKLAGLFLVLLVASFSFFPFSGFVSASAVETRDVPSPTPISGTGATGWALVLPGADASASMLAFALLLVLASVVFYFG